MLGVPHGASPAVVLEAFRRLSKVHHPDREGGSAERFVEIRQAYEALRARPAPDPAVDERLATIERELRDGARRKPARADAQPAPDRAGARRTPARMDAQSDVSRAGARRTPARDARADAVVRGVNDLIDGLDGLASQLD